MSEAAVGRPPSPALDPRQVLLQFRQDPIGLLERVARGCGDIACLDVGRFRVFLIAHPDYVRDVLVTHQDRFVKGEVLEGARRLLGQGLLTSEGDLHKRQRRIIQPVFHHERLTDLAGLMVEQAARACAGWGDGQTLDVQDEMVTLTMSMLAEAVFGADIGAEEARRTARALAVALDLFARLASPFARLLEEIQSEKNREFEETLKSFDATVARLIEDRRATGTEGTDLLSRLMRARDADTGERMTDRQTRDEILTFLIAGHETWSNSLGWTWYLLSENPEARLRLEAEVDAILGGRLPTAEDVRQLSYTDMVYTESLRLYPTAWTVARTAVVDHELDGFLIPSGSIVLISPYIVHHDPRWFPDPFEFRPERWEGKEQKVPTFAYFPFSAGSRVCIGQPLAKLGGVLSVATIAQLWRLDLVPGHPVEPSAPLLRPAHGLPMTVSARSGEPIGHASAPGG